MLGRGWIPPPQDFYAFFIWPKTAIYRIVLFIKQFDIWPSSVIWEVPFLKCWVGGNSKVWPKTVIYRTSNIVLWIWNITFNKFLFVHIFQLCLWIVWTGVIGAVATIMTWWRTTSQILSQRIKAQSLLVKLCDKHFFCRGVFKLHFGKCFMQLAQRPQISVHT